MATSNLKSGCGALIFCSKTNRYLFLLRTKHRMANHWGIVGGKIEASETVIQGLVREIQEEIGQPPEIIKTIPLETFVSNDKVFNFHTYLCVVENEFIPILSDEHIAWAWCSIDFSPKPLHQGLKNSFSNKIMRTKLQTIFDIIDLI